MPLVNETITMAAEPVRTKVEKEHIHYVTPAKAKKLLKAGDCVLAEPTPKQLVELMELYPDEYGEDGYIGKLQNAE